MKLFCFEKCEKKEPVHFKVGGIVSTGVKISIEEHEEYITLKNEDRVRKEKEREKERVKRIKQYKKSFTCPINSKKCVVGKCPKFVQPHWENYGVKIVSWYLTYPSCSLKPMDSL